MAFVFEGFHQCIRVHHLSTSDIQESCRRLEFRNDLLTDNVFRVLGERTHGDENVTFRGHFLKVAVKLEACISVRYPCHERHRGRGRECPYLAQWHESARPTEFQWFPFR